MCALCVGVCALVCRCPSGCDCAGDDDNGCPWDVDAESLQATLPGLTERHNISIHLFFCSVSLESVGRVSPCHFNLQDELRLSDDSVSLFLLVCVCVVVTDCSLFFSSHKCTCMAVPCYLARHR